MRYGATREQEMADYDMENDLQARAEEVAYRHWRNLSPEFVEWVQESLNDKIDAETVASIVVALTREAHLVQQAKGVADTIRDMWVNFVVNATDYSPWAMERQMYREVRGRK